MIDFYDKIKEDPKNPEQYIVDGETFKEIISEEVIQNFPLNNIKFTNGKLVEGEEDSDEKKFVIQNHNFESDLKFSNCIFEEELSFINCSFREDVTFKNCTFKNKVILDGNKLAKYLIFDNPTFCKNVFIKKSSDLEGSFCKLKFDTVSFQKINGEYPEIFLENNSLDKLHLKYFTNQAINFRLINTKIISKLQLESSTLDNMEFTGLNLENAEKIKIKNSSFYKTLFNNVKWGDVTENRFNTDSDTLRQLKHANDLQGNHIQANKFYRLEMIKYGKELEWYNFLDKIVFTAGKYVSDFSQNWFLPLFWYFCIGIVLFALVCFQEVNPSFLDFANFVNPFVNPCNLEKFTNPEASIAVKNTIIIYFIFRFIAIFIGYQLVISLRAKTRRR